jgi:hypothetical protein
MCNSQDVVDAFGKEMVSMKLDVGFWYHGFLGTIYAMTMTGHLWTPDLLKTTAINKNKTVSVSSMVVTNKANRELSINGIKNATSIFLTTLDGHQVKQTNNIANGSTTLDISSIKRGCYIISARESNGQLQKGQVVILN